MYCIFFCLCYIYCYILLYIYIFLIVWGFFFYIVVFVFFIVIFGNICDMCIIIVCGFDFGNGYSFWIKVVNVFGVGFLCILLGECVLYNVF